MELPASFWSQLSFLSVEEQNALNASFDEEASVAIRLNAHKLPRATKEPVPWSQGGHYLPVRPSFTADPLFHVGGYYVQEPSSMIIGTLVRQLVSDQPEPVTILDLCGAPGGKSTDIANQMRPGDVLVSNEVIHSRVSILKENVIKWGAPDHHVTSNDPADFQRLPGVFDLVVVDAPCSGEGLFRKDPRARDQWSPAAVNLCQQRQLRIVRDVWDTLKEGGVLIYSTCTLNEQENEGVLRQLIADLEVEPVRFQADAGWSFQQYEVEGFQQFKVFPHLTRGEGFSFFLLRKRETVSAFKFKRRRPIKRRGLPSHVHDWLGVGTEDIRTEGDKVLYYGDESLVDALDQQLRLVKKGTWLGTLKKDRLVPAHELAMATFINSQTWPKFELDYEEAITYLRKTTIAPPVGERGFGLVTFKDLSLGWVNHLGNRVNNLYPSEYRILSQQSFQQPDIL